MDHPRACAAILVEAGETFGQGAVREVKEETGLDVQVVRLLFEE